MMIVLPIIGAVIGGFVTYVATRPADFRIVRSKTIAASPSQLYAMIENFHAWADWSPWEKLDPAMNRVFEGPPSGPGAHYKWKSNSKQVGQGQMTITKATQDSVIEIDLEFIQPIAARNKIIFTIRPNVDGANVEWAMEGRNGFT